MTISKIIFISLLFSGTVSSGNSCNKHDKPDEILWAKNIRLKWSYFQGTVPEFNGTVTALSQISLSVKYYNKSEIKKARAYCVFNKYGSWVKEKTDLGLQHEQLHFNIGEYCKRLLQNKIDSVITRNRYITELTIETIFRESKEYHKKMQLLYDSETSHGVYTLQQNTWEEKVEDWLKQTK